jgi:hypothetical protein
LADETRDAIGVSGGISEGERLRVKGEAQSTAPKATDENLVIIMTVDKAIWKGLNKGGEGQ